MIKRHFYKKDVAVNNLGDFVVNYTILNLDHVTF